MDGSEMEGSAGSFRPRKLAMPPPEIGCEIHTTCQIKSSVMSHGTYLLIWVEGEDHFAGAAVSG